MENLKENKMGIDSILRLTISMSIPAMFAMIIQTADNIIDSFFVSRISESALTAVTLAFPIQALSSAIAIGTSLGINSLISRCLGKSDKQKANSVDIHGIIFGLFSYILFAAFGLLFSKSFISLFTSSQEIIDMGSDYLTIITLFSFALFIELNVEMSIRATGDPIHPMISQFLASITHIILGPIFIFGFGFIPAMGVKGAAIATVSGDIIAMSFILFIAKNKNSVINLTFKNLKFDTKIIKEIYIVGFRLYNL